MRKMDDNSRHHYGNLRLMCVIVFFYVVILFDIAFCLFFDLPYWLLILSYVAIIVLGGVAIKKIRDKVEEEELKKDDFRHRISKERLDELMKGYDDWRRPEVCSEDAQDSQQPRESFFYCSTCGARVPNTLDCPICGFFNPSFCRRCCTPLHPATKVCPMCGLKNPIGQVYID